MGGDDGGAEDSESSSVILKAKLSQRIKFSQDWDDLELKDLLRQISSYSELWTKTSLWVVVKKGMLARNRLEHNVPRSLSR